jgi:hypothetical protein
MRRYLLIICYHFCLLAASAQAPCPKFNYALAQGRKHLASNSFDQALTEFQAAQVAIRECDLDGTARQRVIDLLEVAFDGLEQERNTAVAARKQAVQAEARARQRLQEAQAAREAADKALAHANALGQQSERLLGALYFYADRFAVAVRRERGWNKYGFIDKDGQTRIGYLYDKALPFEAPGFARVEKQQQAYLIDTLGQEYLLAERLSDLQPETEALQLQNVRSLPDTILNFPNLKILLLSRCDIKTLPEAIGQLHRLEYIDLLANPITELPESIVQLHRLKHLDLGGGSLTDIPDQIGQLTQLEYLNLSSNQLTTLPASFDQLTRLQHLSLYNNKLETLSFDLRQFPQLKYLHLGATGLREFPNAIKSLKQLSELRLSDNQLTIIPDFLATMPSLAKVDLSNNPIIQEPDLQFYTNSAVLEASIERLMKGIEENTTDPQQQLTLYREIIRKLDKIQSLDSGFKREFDEALFYLYTSELVEHTIIDPQYQLIFYREINRRLDKVKSLDSAFKGELDNALLYLYIARFQLRAGQFGKAAQTVNEAAQRFEDGAYVPNILLPPILLLQGQYAEARSIYLKWKEEKHPDIIFNSVYAKTYLDDLEMLEKLGIIPEAHLDEVAEIKKLLMKDE